MHRPDPEPEVPYDAWVDHMQSLGVLTRGECEGLSRVARVLAEAYEWADAESFAACMRSIANGIGMQIVRGKAKARVCPPEACPDPAVRSAGRWRAGAREARRARSEGR